MQRHILFLVHGMGEHPVGWSDAIRSQLQQQYEQLERSRLWPWNESFQVVEIEYDSCFEMLRSMWQSTNSQVLDQLSDGGLQKSALSKLSSLTDSAGEDSFVTTHVLDVLLYRFIPTVHEAVKTRVGRQITETLSSLPSGGSWSVIAHSLGTAVAHDTLHALDVGQDTDSSSVRPAHLLLSLANVSRVLQSDVKAYASNVRPALPGKPGVLRHFLDVHHKWDPIPAVWPFEPHDTWPDTPTRQAGLFRETRLTAISAPNVHGFDHYLKDPACYIPLYRHLTMPELIPAGEEQALRARFLETHPQADFDRARRRLEKLFRKKAGNDLDLVTLLINYFREIRHD